MNIWEFCEITVKSEEIYLNKGLKGQKKTLIFVLNLYLTGRMKGPKGGE